jgi:phenylacetic acid degradation protein paaN
MILVLQPGKYVVAESLYLKAPFLGAFFLYFCQMNSNLISIDNLESLYSNYTQRQFYAFYPEDLRAYDASFNTHALANFQASLNTNFHPNDSSASLIGEEVSPFLNVGLGINYNAYNDETLIQNSQNAFLEWSEISVQKRFEVLCDIFNALGTPQMFFDLAYATMHTTGQSFMMSFQASGPHALDRGLEVLAVAYHELNKFPSTVNWEKDFGKFSLKLFKNYKPISVGVGLVIGCSTFPSWNSFPSIIANLITGNSVIVKPHPKAILPLAMIVNSIQTVFLNHGLNKNIIQLAVDTVSNPITKILCENPAVKLIDYTGGNSFASYLYTLTNKIVFTEQAGVNSVLVDSSDNLDKSIQNLVFSASLYSGQMCTAPQNIYVSKDGINTPEGVIGFDDFCEKLKIAAEAMSQNPKAGPATFGAIQNDNTLKNIDLKTSDFKERILQSGVLNNEEFKDAKTQSLTIVKTTSKEKQTFQNEIFGPFLIVIQTDSFEESLALAKESAAKFGAITCLAYCVDKDRIQRIEREMNSVFTPVSFNFQGAAFVNQHAAFSDFHVTGGNPAGNATFTDSNFVNRRYFWVGNRYYTETF